MNHDQKQQFYGVYLLYCTNIKYKGRTYIGFTVDPNRRLKQHNEGKHAGGAWKTSNRGPWKMVLIVHGFPNEISALRFEWAWQHPQVSRHLSFIPKKQQREKTYDYCIRVLFEMLSVKPWYRLPLTLRWLEEDFVRQPPPDRLPPVHIPIVFGQVDNNALEPLKYSKKCIPPNEESGCFICSRVDRENKVHCVFQSCEMISHIICLSKLFLKSDEYVPVEGICPLCKQNFLWADVINNSNEQNSEVESCNFDLNEDFS